ncbi:MAG: ferritin-like domain-containing protein [Myxococcota bacterium]
MSASDQVAPRVGAEWLRRVEAEYTSAAITAEFVQWLIRLGASPDLIRDGLRIVDDELEHASLSHAVATEAGSEERPELIQERLGLQRNPDRPLLIDAAVQGVDIFCLGETVAVPLFVAMRETCTVPVARVALDRIVRDEVRHRDFGWTFLQWLIDTHGESMRSIVEGELAGLFRGVRVSYGQSDYERRREEPIDADADWGLMHSARYHEILLRTYDRDYVPRFARVGIDARKAWEQDSE